VRRWAVLITLVGISCSPQPPSTEPFKPRVKAVVLARQEVARELESFGTISVLKKADVSNLVEGTVETLAVEEGQPVRRGQILTRLKNPQLELRRTQADSALEVARSAVSVSRAQLWEGRLQVQARVIALEKAKLALDEKQLEWNEAERTYKNKQQLYDAGGTTQDTLAGLRLSVAGQEAAYQGLLKDWESRRIGLRDDDLVSYGMAVPSDPAQKLDSLVRLNTLSLLADLESAESKLAAAEADVRSAQTMVEALTVVSPLDGILGARYVEAGEHAQPGTKLVTVIDTSAVYAVFPLSEEDAVAVVEGLRVDVAVDAFPGQTFGARVDLVSPLVDPQTGTVSVKAKLGNLPVRLKPGMFARVKVRLASSAEVLLPESAVVQKTGAQAKIYTVVNGRILAKDVELGKNLGGRYLLVSGALESDLVVDSPSLLLKEGEEVDAR
jgi:multidrug efflux pump subunit AcrA (membrane-fusion protein)